MPLAKIISGGQTGADRAALDAALELGFPCGGWCPPGRLAADGPIPLSYPLIELASGGYRRRTIKNIEDSDATVIFFFGQPEGGSKLTHTQCERLGKPYLLIDTNTMTVSSAAMLINAFVTDLGAAVVNIAGPSEGRTPGTYTFVHATICKLINSAAV
jgi:hypothetical protein